MNNQHVIPGFTFEQIFPGFVNVNGRYVKVVGTTAARIAIEGNGIFNLVITSTGTAVYNGNVGFLACRATLRKYGLD